MFPWVLGHLCCCLGWHGGLFYRRSVSRLLRLLCLSCFFLSICILWCWFSPCLLVLFLSTGLCPVFLSLVGIFPFSCLFSIWFPLYSRGFHLVVLVYFGSYCVGLDHGWPKWYPFHYVGVGICFIPGFGSCIITITITITITIVFFPFITSSNFLFVVFHLFHKVSEGVEHSVFFTGLSLLCLS